MRVFDEIEGLVITQWDIIKTCLAMTKLEAQLAKMSIYPMLVCIFLLLLSAISTWLIGMCLLVYVLMQAFGNVMMAILVALLINILLLSFIFSYLLINLNRMSFSKTRAYLKERATNDIKKTNNSANKNLE